MPLTMVLWPRSSSSSISGRITTITSIAAFITERPCSIVQAMICCAWATSRSISITFSVLPGETASSRVLAVISSSDGVSPKRSV